MKETARTATKKGPAKTTRSHSESPTTQKKSSSSTTVHRASPKPAHSAKAENPNPHRRVRAAAGTEKPAQKRRTHVAWAKRWAPEGPVHIGGVRNPAPEPPVHFAGVENHSQAAHLNDFRAEPHPKPAANPIHGPFPGHRKQP